MRKYLILLLIPLFAISAFADGLAPIGGGGGGGTISAGANTIVGNNTGSTANAAAQTSFSISSSGTASFFNATLTNSGYELGGATGLYYNSADSGTTGSSIGIGPGSLAGQTAAGSAAYNNVCIGIYCLGTFFQTGQTTAAINNTCVGQECLGSNKTGFNNIAVGPRAGVFSTGGFNNIWICPNCGQANQQYNVQIDPEAQRSGGGSVSVQIGADTDAWVGSNGTIVGSDAAYNDEASGSTNQTIIGSNVGRNNAGSGGVVTDLLLIGVNANVDASSPTAQHEIHIGGQGGDMLFTSGTATTATEINTFYGNTKFSGGIISTGTKFSTTGCSLSATTGGANVGTYVSGTTGACTVVITMNGATGASAPNGWICQANDITTTADVQRQTATNATTATISGTTVSGDVINFSCLGY